MSPRAVHTEGLTHPMAVTRATPLGWSLRQAVACGFQSAGEAPACFPGDGRHTRLVNLPRDAHW